MVFRFLVVITFGCFLFLGMTAGGAIVHFKLPPLANFYDDAFTGFDALVGKRKIRSQRIEGSLSGPPVVTINESGALQGYTLIASRWKAGAELYDMQGKSVYQWILPRSKVWGKDDFIDSPLPDNRVFWHDAYLYPNGDILLIYNAEGDFPFGYGLVKIDKDSNVLWTYDAHVHHYLNVGDDGNIYVLTQAFSDEPVANMELSKFPITRDYLVILSPEGKELRKISLLDVLAQSPYYANIGITHDTRDLLHTNFAVPLPRDIQPSLDIMKPGQVLLSFRNIDTLALLDLESETIVRAWRGPWYAQHSPHPLTNGNIALFDNKPTKLPYSRILEFNPVTGGIEWNFTGSESYPFFTYWAGSVQPLDNGNYLISETWGNKVFEVTRDKRVVWEAKVKGAHQARRYLPSQVPFLKTPG